jgi:putative glutamine amidotransferase
MIPVVNDGSSDAIWCGHGITAERAALLEFPRPFAIFVESVLVRSDAIVTEPSDLSGLRIAAITASTNMALVETFPTAITVAFDGALVPLRHQSDLKVAITVATRKEAIFRTEGDLFLLPPGVDIHERLRCAHGAVVPGKADLDPASYGHVRDERTEDTDPVQDAYGIAFTRTLLDLQIPFLAICQGMQVLDVGLGGTLVQFLDETTWTNRQAKHRVTLDAGSATAIVIGGHSFEVSSYHHQAVDQLGDGLHIVGGADGCIEVLQHCSGPAARRAVAPGRRRRRRPLRATPVRLHRRRCRSVAPRKVDCSNRKGSHNPRRLT